MFGSRSEKIVIAGLIVAVIAAGAAIVYLRGNGPTVTQPPPQFAPMTLQQTFAGPLEGTTIQRWRDPLDGTVCYIYGPLVVHHDPAPSGYVQYGSNSIGSISCLPGTGLITPGPGPAPK